MRKFAVTVWIMLVCCAYLGCDEEFGIKDVSPAVGVLGGGEPVTIRGSGFNPNLGLTVYFGNQKADNVVVSSVNKLTVTTPSSPKPTVVDVRVATDDGKEYLIRRGFRYIEKAAMDIRDLGKRRSQRDKPE
ncbi:MAG: IPT/TIG domain-containing protein [Myxococcota bacterium]|nr:IPT/TIG domain-containing protein [Myxococcota bacterium]